jgi:competence protein ComEA
VHEAIRAAGGVRRGANLGALNRAAVLVDGQQVLVPDAAPAAAGSEASSGGSATVSINSADVDALDALPGIGPVTAQHIVDEREAAGPFARVDDLDRVSGIGPATIEALRDVVTT